MTLAARRAMEERERKRLRELDRCKRSLWYLLTEYLNYSWNPNAAGEPYPGKGLTEELHRPICNWFDARRDHTTAGLWLSRWHHKTTIIVGMIIQDILIDPTMTMFYFHAVDEQAEATVGEVGWHILNNEKLRSLDPVGLDSSGKPYRIFPASNNKRALKSDRLTVNRRSDRPIRFPTLLGKGVGSEVTGAHARKAYLDDIVARRTIENSELGKVQSWVQNTVMPVVDDSIFRVTATRWHHEAIYEDWIRSKDWATIVLPCSVPPEHDFIANPSVVDWSQDKIYLPGDKKFHCPIYGPESYRPTQRKKLEFYYREMGPDFDPQMMNDPSPSGEKPWHPSSCEHYVSMKDMVRYGGPAVRFVLSDPAPAKVGSFDEDRKKRLDGSKDFWATCVVEIRTHEARQEIVLLDGVHSRDWGRDEGFEQICRLMKKWVTPYVALESTGQAIALYEDDLRQAARRVGTPYTFVKLANTYKGKNVQFRGLADKAGRDEFLICETVPPEFLQAFLDQAREWRPLPSGRNSLKYDDVANCVSFSVDPALQEFAPQPMLRDPFDALDEELEGGRAFSRYCGV